MEKSIRTIIHNLPSYPLERYIVARECQNQAWFYGAYDDKDVAKDIAEAIDGIVFENLEKEGEKHE